MSEQAMPGTVSGGYLVDGHVHLYPGMALGQVLTAAAGHMARAAQALGWTARPPGLLMLTENFGLDRFAELAGDAEDWRVEMTGESVSRIARAPNGGAPIAIISGRQIVTAEGLEVHALGTRTAFAEKRSIFEVLTELSADGALAVLPWGVGKWSGRRGRVVANLIADCDHPGSLLLADSGVRPDLLPRPALLAAGEARGLKVLAGSDPLPLAAEAGKAGRFGFIARHEFDEVRPFAALRAWLATAANSPETYGHLEGVFGFVRAQAAMQIRKRLRR